MTYRAEIDGLRAWALLSVILFHAGFKHFSGGFVGVDIFFVISGYLIAGVITSDLDEGRFSLVGFYERRARRILPALFFMMLVSIPVAWIVLSESDLVDFSRSMIAVSLFCSNYFFISKEGYFATAAELKPFLHTWSLSVEEQYYIVFPVVILICWPVGRRWVVRLIAAAALLSFVAAQLYSASKPVDNFFVLPTRAWELAIGALAGLCFNSNPHLFLTCRMRQIYSVLGLIFVATPVFLFEKDTPSPSFYTLVPTVGAALLLLYAQMDTFVGRVLGCRVLVFIGLISYSAYLWHQPLFAFARYSLGEIGAKEMIVLVALTIMIGALSWKFVETPFRKSSFLSRRSLFVFCGAMILLTVTFGYATSKLFTALLTYPVEAKMANVLVGSRAIYSSDIDERKLIKYRLQVEGLSPASIVVGSSRIKQMRMKEGAVEFINLGVSGCSLEDIVAIADLAADKLKPTTIYLGLDPWLFNSNSEQTRWKSISDEYNVALAKLNGVDIPVYKGRVMVDGGCGSMFGAKLYYFVNKQKISANNELAESRDKIRRDGSLIYSSIYANKTPKEVSDGVAGWLDYSMVNYNHSKDLESLFERFVDYYSSRFKIVFVLPPYHPYMYERMRKERPIYGVLEQYFRAVASRHDIEVIGSYDPEVAGYSSADFYDVIHPRFISFDRGVVNPKR